MVDLEILSIGQKIKRARVYKRYTLKDLCDNEISISKMSCIENDKIIPEESIIKFIAKRLDLDLDYLNETIEEQLTKNLILVENCKGSSEYVELLKYNIDIANKYGSFDIAFNTIHKLFNCYLDLNKKEKVESIIPQYYDSCSKLEDCSSRLIYFMDIGRYLFLSEEFSQASNYYNNIIKELDGKEDVKMLARAIYNESNCYFRMGDINKAYEVGERLTELVDYVDDKLIKADIYHMLALFSVKNNDIGTFKYYEEKSYENYGDDFYRRLQSIFDFASVMFEFGFKDLASNYVNIVIEEYPREDKEQIVKFVLKNINILIENDMVYKAQDICEEVLNYSIDLEDERYIEKSYYYKAIILRKQNDLASAEMHMSLSLGILAKFGSKLDLYHRYMEIGNIYYSLGCITEALEYFSLAISLESKI